MRSPVHSDSAIAKLSRCVRQRTRVGRRCSWRGGTVYHHHGRHTRTARARGHARARQPPVRVRNCKVVSSLRRELDGAPRVLMFHRPSVHLARPPSSGTSAKLDATLPSAPIVDPLATTRRWDLCGVLLSLFVTAARRLTKANFIHCDVTLHSTSRSPEAGAGGHAIFVGKSLMTGKTSKSLVYSAPSPSHRLFIPYRRI